MDMGPMRLHLLHDGGEFVEEFLVSVQGEQVFLSEQEAKAVALRPAQAVTRGCGHGGDSMLDINHGVQLTCDNINMSVKKSIFNPLCDCFSCPLTSLTVLSTAASSLLQRVLPVVQLHAKSTTQRGGGLWIGDLHHIDVTVCGAEVAAVEGGHFGFSLLKGGPCSVLKYPSKLLQKKEKERYRSLV